MIFNLIVPLILIRFSTALYIINNDHRSACDNNFAYCRCPTNQFVSCIGFPSFQTLNFSSSNSEIPLVDYFQLQPSTPLKFDSSLDLSGLRLSSQCDVALTNLDSIEFTANPFDPVKNATTLKSFSLDSSNLRFLFLNVSITSATCTRNQLSSSKTFFTTFRSIQFEAGVQYPQLCPYIFANVDLDLIELTNLTNFNRFEFVSISSLDADLLKASIRKLQITFSQIKSLDEKLLEKSLFKEIRDLVITDSFLG